MVLAGSNMIILSTSFGEIMRQMKTDLPFMLMAVRWRRWIAGEAVVVLILPAFPIQATRIINGLH